MQMDSFDYDDRPLDMIPEPPRPTHRSWWRSLLSIVWFISVVVFLVVIINGFALQSYQVIGSSMETTLHDGDRLIISKFGKSLARLQNEDYIPDRGEIVVFKNPADESIQLIKRVVGLPGERVLVKDGIITVFNDQNPEGFNPDLTFGADFLYTVGEINTVVPEDEVFVVGDNRAPGASHDSRNNLGTVPDDEIQGKLILRIFPLQNARFF